MHSKNVIHRDLKPDNIFIVNNTAKIGDLGLASVLEGTQEQAKNTSISST